HAVRVVAPLNSRALIGCRIHKFVGQLFRHRTAATAARCHQQPTHRQRKLTASIDRRWHLIGGTTYTARFYLNLWRHVLDGLLKHLNGWPLGPLLNEIK